MAAETVRGGGVIPNPEQSVMSSDPTTLPRAFFNSIVQVMIDGRLVGIGLRCLESKCAVIVHKDHINDEFCLPPMTFAAAATVGYHSIAAGSTGRSVFELPGVSPCLRVVLFDPESAGGLLLTQLDAEDGRAWPSLFLPPPPPIEGASEPNPGAGFDLPRDGDAAMVYDGLKASLCYFTWPPAQGHDWVSGQKWMLRYRGALLPAPRPFIVADQHGNIVGFSLGANATCMLGRDERTVLARAFLEHVTTMAPAARRMAAWAYDLQSLL